VQPSWIKRYSFHAKIVDTTRIFEVFDRSAFCVTIGLTRGQRKPITSMFGEQIVKKITSMVCPFTSSGVGELYEIADITLNQ